MQTGPLASRWKIAGTWSLPSALLLSAHRHFPCHFPSYTAQRMRMMLTGDRHVDPGGASNPPNEECIAKVQVAPEPGFVDL